MVPSPYVWPIRLQRWKLDCGLIDPQSFGTGDKARFDSVLQDRTQGHIVIHSSGGRFGTLASANTRSHRSSARMIRVAHAARSFSQANACPAIVVQRTAEGINQAASRLAARRSAVWAGDSRQPTLHSAVQRAY